MYFVLNASTGETVFVFPTVSDMAQVERLARLVASQQKDMPLRGLCVDGSWKGGATRMPSGS